MDRDEALRTSRRTYTVELPEGLVAEMEARGLWSGPYLGILLWRVIGEHDEGVELEKELDRQRAAAGEPTSADIARWVKEASAEARAARAART